MGEQAQYNITVFVKKRGGIIPSEIEEGIPYNIKLMGGRDWPSYKKWYIQFYLSPFIKGTDNPVIISANWELSAGLIKYRKKNDFSLITVLHGLEVTRLHSRKYQQRSGNFKKTLFNSDAVVAVSDFTKTEAIGISSYEEIVTIPNFVDTRNFYPKEKNECRSLFQFQESDKILLTLSRLVRRKGHETVIKALQTVKEEIPDIKFVIAGTGDKSYENKLNRLISELHLKQNVVFLGYVEESSKNTLYNASDVYIMNSTATDEKGDSEGFGITFLEANACGKPVIGSKSGGIPDAVEQNVNGLLVEPDNPGDTATAILTLFSNKELYRRMSQNAIFRTKQKFDLLKIGAEYEKIISSLSPSH